MDPMRLKLLSSAFLPSTTRAVRNPRATTTRENDDEPQALDEGREPCRKAPGTEPAVKARTAAWP
jgi:hypothetical protein